MQRICIYCGSNFGNNVAYSEAAKLLALELVRRNIGLVYGGASVGLMGLMADTVLEHGGNAIGVIPQSLADHEIAHTGLSELFVVNTMHERKAKMAELSDGFIALPGGFGTLEELFEALTWLHLDFQKKPCAALNVNGYYNKLFEFIGYASEEGFIKKDSADLLIMEQNPVTIVDRMIEFTLASKVSSLAVAQL